MNRLVFRYDNKTSLSTDVLFNAPAYRDSAHKQHALAVLNRSVNTKLAIQELMERHAVVFAGSDKQVIEVNLLTYDHAYREAFRIENVPVDLAKINEALLAKKNLAALSEASENQESMAA